jgi:hypothetical protein
MHVVKGLGDCTVKSQTWFHCTEYHLERRTAWLWAVAYFVIFRLCVNQREADSLKEEERRIWEGKGRHDQWELVAVW